MHEPRSTPTAAFAPLARWTSSASEPLIAGNAAIVPPIRGPTAPVAEQTAATNASATAARTTTFFPTVASPVRRGCLLPPPISAARGRSRAAATTAGTAAASPALLATLAEAAQDLRVEVLQRESAPALEDLRSRAVDVVVGVDYDPVPVGRHRDVDRRDLLHEDVLLAIPAHHPLAAGGRPVALEPFAGSPWAAGHRGTGHGALVENVCNRLGGYAPDIRHRTDDVMILRALVSSGRAVTLLPALIGTATPRVAVRALAEGPLRRAIFTAARAAGADMPAVTAVRTALASAARAATFARDDVQLA